MGQKWNYQYEPISSMCRLSLLDSTLFDFGIIELVFEGLPSVYFFSSKVNCTKKGLSQNRLKVQPTYQTISFSPVFLPFEEYAIFFYINQATHLFRIKIIR